MTLEAFLLVVCAAALHATWNLVSKKAAGAAGDFVFTYRLISMVLYAPWVAYILWFDGMQWNATVVLFVVLASVLHLAYSLCLQRGYQVADLSVVYPIARGTGPLLSSLGAFILLGEHSSGSGLLGIACVVAGIMLIASGGQLRRFLTPAAMQGIRWGLFIGFFIALYTLVDAYSVKVLLVAPVVLDWLSALGSVILMTPRAIVRRKTMMVQMQGKWRYAFIVGLLSPLAYILVLYAYQMGGNVSLIAPLREMSMMMGTIAGFFILKEKASPARIMGCVIIIAGVILLAA
ncbi:EamA family transporter [Pusillimonas sp. ANT_WB101]|uniref:EamA family transporter n=1 Tax=Pusillimonas sp. ANT_WB101 TaxID=2597356 RepID=UPI0011ECCBA6|nr:EamA family transporter [Pusillimonas sp. ANT_WB101]KAA0911030.1 EamA family transporter [Pusillimonas sp. ANT_WB101]